MYLLHKLPVGLCRDDIESKLDFKKVLGNRETMNSSVCKKNFVTPM